MKQYQWFWLLICLIFALPSLAQDDTCPYLECRYTSQAKSNALNKDKVNQDEWALRIAKDCAEFYSVWYRAHQTVIDSVLSKGGTLEDCFAAREKILYPKSTNSDDIFKNYPEPGRLTYVKEIVTDPYLYEETYERPAWQIKAEKKDIMGYACQKATADFRGPGLILEAYDAEDDYHYTCIEIKRLQGEKPIRVPQKKYVKCDRKELDKLLSIYKNSINDYRKLQGKSLIYQVQNDGTITANFSQGVVYNPIERE